MQSNSQLEKLKFTAVRGDDCADDPVEITVSAKYKDAKYTLKIKNNFRSCQHPDVVLTDLACADYIESRIESEKFTYSVDEAKYCIYITIPVYDHITIRLTLSGPKGVDLLESKITYLDKRVTKLERWTLVETHTYPKWNTLDEFKALPGFKYFKVIEDFMSLPTKTYPSKGSHAGPDMFIFGSLFDKAYGVTTRPDHKHGTVKFYDKYFTTSMEIAPENKFSGWDAPPGCGIGGKDASLLDTLNREHEEEHYAPFPKSVEKLVIHQGASMSYWLMMYLRRYLKGYLLVNREQVAFKNVKVNVRVTDTECIMKIFVSKARRYDGLFSQVQDCKTNMPSQITRKVYVNDFLIVDGIANPE